LSKCLELLKSVHFRCCESVCQRKVTRLDKGRILIDLSFRKEFLRISALIFYLSSSLDWAKGSSWTGFCFSHSETGCKGAYSQHFAMRTPNFVSRNRYEYRILRIAFWHINWRLVSAGWARMLHYLLISRTEWCGLLFRFFWKIYNLSNLAAWHKYYGMRAFNLLGR